MRTPYPFARHCLCLAPTALLLVCIRLFIGTEDAVFAYFSALRPAFPELTHIIGIFTHGVLFVFYPLYGLFLVRGLWSRKVDDILFFVCWLAAQLLVAALLCRVIKIAVGRPRPMTGGGFVPFSFGWGYQSFPSGHTGEITGACVPFLWRYETVAPFFSALCLGVIVAAVAFSRIYLGMHHPSDIWGGLAVGSLSGYVSWMFYGLARKHWRRFASRKAALWMETGVKQGVGHE